MRKVVFIVSSLAKTGPTQVLLDLIRGINTEEFYITLITIGKSLENTRFEEFNRLKIEIVDLNLTRIDFLIYGNKRLYSMIDSINPDIIHTMGVRADVAISQNKKYSNKHISTIHCFVDEEYIFYYGKVIGEYLAKKHKKAMERIHIPVCCSKTLATKYRANNVVQNPKLCYIQNGIDSTKFDMKPKKECRKKLKLPLEKKIFIFVGRLTPHKNPSLVIEAFKEAKRLDSLLLVLGDGKLYDLLKKENDGNIHILGSVNNVDEYLNASNYYISASLTEGLPLSVMEAGMSGLGLLLSDIPQHKEIIDSCPNKGVFYFDELDVTCISNVMKKVDKIDNIFIHNYFVKNFSSIRMAKEYIELYKNLIQEEEIL